MSVTRAVPVRVKDPEQDRVQAVDFTGQLALGNHLSAGTATMVVDPPGSLTAAIATVVGDTVNVLVSGGTDGSDYFVKVKVNTVSSFVVTATFKVEVRNGAL